MDIQTAETKNETPNVEGKSKSKKKPKIIREVKEKVKNTNSTLPIVDSKPPKLIPDLYLKPQKLIQQVKEQERILYDNLQLLTRVNITNRRGGWVDCWALPDNMHTSERLTKKRIDRTLLVCKENEALYRRLTSVEPRVFATAYLNEEWKHTLDKIKLSSNYPFCLQSTKTIDCGMVDPEFTDVGGKLKYWMRFTAGEILIGTVTMELFEKIVPQVCKLFKMLSRGRKDNKEGYFGTRIFTIVPDMYCTGGDVTKNNGFGGMSQVEEESWVPDNCLLKHSIPGVLSMPVVNGKLNGTFNITFRPMPLMDGKNVVFGRIVSGNYSILETLGSMGSALGVTRNGPKIDQCGWVNRRHKYKLGRPNTIITPS